MTEIPGGFNPERVSNVVNLSKDIKAAGFIGDTSSESAEKARNFLKTSFGSDYESVDQMVAISRDTGRTEAAQINAKNALDSLGAAVLLAGGSKVEDLACSGELNQNVPSTFHGIDSIVNSNLFVKDENDEVGKLIVYKLREVEAFNIKAKIAPNAFESKRPAVVQEKIDALFDKYAEVQEDSEEAMKLGVVIGHLDSSIQKSGQKLNNSSDDFDEETIAEKNTIRPEVFVNAQGEEESYGGYGPDMVTFAKKVLIGTRTDLRDSMPPLWYKDFIKDPSRAKKKEGKLGLEKGSIEQWKYKTIADLADFSGTKLALKDGDLETLATKGRPQMEKYDFKVLYEMDEKIGFGLPGFKESLEVMVDDLFNYDDKTGLLSIKTIDSFKGSEDPKIAYNEYLKKFDPFLDYEDDLAKQLLKGEGLFKDKKIKGIKTLDQAKIAVGTAWNFLFIGDTMESADENRVLDPGKGYGDKVAAMFHPEAKMLRKFKFKKRGGLPEKDDLRHEKEDYGGSYGEWLYKRIVDDNKLREKVSNGEISIFPKRLTMSFIESFGVYALKEGKLIEEQGKPVEISMARALKEGLTIVTNPEQVVEKNPEQLKLGIRQGVNESNFNFVTQAPMMIKYRDIYQASYKMFNQLQGKVEIRKGDELKWIKDFRDNMALIRQSKIPGKPNYLGHVDDTDFLKIAIANTVGVKSDLTSGLYLNVTDDPDVYYTSVKKMLNTPGLILGSARTDTINKLLEEFNATSVVGSMMKLKKAIKLSQKEVSKGSRFF